VEKSIVEELIGGMPSWTEEANCKGADADLFFPERELLLVKPKQYVGHVQCKINVLNML
jgi:hypothetical protein